MNSAQRLELINALAEVYGDALFRVTVSHADAPAAGSHDVVDFETLLSGYGWVLHLLPHREPAHFSLTWTADLVRTSILLEVAQ